jgi:hypothetical protein
MECFSCKFRYEMEFEFLLEEVAAHACATGLCKYGEEVVVVHGVSSADADGTPMQYIKVSRASWQYGLPATFYSHVFACSVIISCLKLHRQKSRLAFTAVACAGLSIDKHGDTASHII